MENYNDTDDKQIVVHKYNSLDINKFQKLRKKKIVIWWIRKHNSERRVGKLSKLL